MKIHKIDFEYMEEAGESRVSNVYPLCHHNDTADYKNMTSEDYEVTCKTCLRLMGAEKGMK